MGKIATKYLKVHPYKIIEEGFHEERNRVSESLFSLSNEFMGIRGSFDEGSSLKTLRGSYFNGIYDYPLTPSQKSYKGIVEKTHFMVNSVDYFKVKILANDEVLDLGKINFENFYRELDLLSGLLTRKLTWILLNGTKIDIKFERFLSLKKCHSAFQRISLVSDKKVDICIDFYLDSNVLHWGKDVYHTMISSENTCKMMSLKTMTKTSKQTIVSSCKIDTNINVHELVNEDLLVGKRYKFTLEKNEQIFTRYVSNYVARNEEELLVNIDSLAIKNLNEISKSGFEEELNNNIKYFANLYERSDIVIEGDDEDQQGVRYCIFMLETTYHGFNELDNIGAKGLTGEAYSGHCFWDSEAVCFPYYLFNNKKAAKNLLMFRYNTLEKAKERAKQLDCGGACYPIATLNGEEACNLWQHASTQFQPTTAVAYAIYHYMNTTKDKAFLRNYGLEMLLECSKFLLDRGQWDQKGTSFGFYGVMGPDEFKVMVNHNTYTNYMAQFTFQYTLKCINRSSLKDSLLKKCGLDANFLDKISKAAKSMKILFNSRTGLYEQNEGFYNLPHIDIHAIPQTDFPLYSNWSYDRIYRGDMIKQPDVLMFMFLFMSKFSDKVKLANYDYYEPRCIHESSLSPCIHSIFACDLKKENEALDFFGFASRLDLDDYNRNTNEGLHLTSISGAWLNIVYGFGGLRSDSGIVSINPSLPARWDSYSFKFVYKRAKITVKVTKHKLYISNNGQDEYIYIDGKKLLITKYVEIDR